MFTKINLYLLRAKNIHHERGIGERKKTTFATKTLVSWHDTIVSRHNTVISWHDTVVSRRRTVLYVTFQTLVSRL